MMPEMDGFEATTAIRKLEPPGARIPIVALTAYSLLEDRDRCLAVGMDDHLSKPVQLEELEDVLVKWTSHQPRSRSASVAG
jgi:CheY-like chemotaxis protein